jgi:hypothetical protein
MAIIVMSSGDKFRHEATASHLRQDLQARNGAILAIWVRVGGGATTFINPWQIAYITDDEALAGPPSE